MDITDKSVIKWQRLQIKNLEDEILRLKTNLNGSQLVLQESIKEYMDEIVSKTDTINELKNTIERQEILIEKLKCCGNCKHDTEEMIIGIPCFTCTTKNYLWELREGE